MWLAIRQSNNSSVPFLVCDSTEHDMDLLQRTAMTSRSYLSPVFAFALVITTVSASAEPEAPWVVGRTSPRWADVKPRRTL